MCINIFQKCLNVHGVLKFVCIKKESNLQIQKGLKMSKNVKTSKSEEN